MDAEFKKLWQQFLRAFRKLRREKRLLQKENEKLKQTVEELKEQNQKLMQEVEATKLLAMTKSEEEKQELKKIIDLYICEIDNCISLIKNEE